MEINRIEAGAEIEAKFVGAEAPAYANFRKPGPSCRSAIELDAAKTDSCERKD